MQAEIIRRYEGKNVKLDLLKQEIEKYLESEGFVVQSSNADSSGIVIQSQRGGWLRALTVGKAVTTIITGQSNDFTIRVGIGIWLKHLSVEAAEHLSVADSLLVGVHPSTLRNIAVEKRILKQVDEFVNQNNRN